MGSVNYQIFENLFLPSGILIRNANYTSLKNSGFSRRIDHMLTFFRIYFSWKNKLLFICSWARTDCYQGAKQLSSFGYCLLIESIGLTKGRDRQNHVHTKRFCLTSNVFITIQSFRKQTSFSLFLLRFSHIFGGSTILCGVFGAGWGGGGSGGAGRGKGGLISTYACFLIAANSCNKFVILDITFRFTCG